MRCLLYTQEEPDIIQGLISLEDKKDHVFMHLVTCKKELVHFLMFLFKHKLFLPIT
jgi:hypothetical protein